MGKRPEEIVHRRGYTDGKAQEKVLKIISYWGNAN